MYERTGGQVIVVDPQNLDRVVSSILKDPPIATNVTVRIIIYTALTFRNESKILKKGNCCILEKDLGSVNIGDEFTFEYTTKLKSELFEMDISL